MWIIKPAKVHLGRENDLPNIPGRCYGCWKSPLAPLHISKKIAQWLVICFLTAKKKTWSRSLYRFFSNSWQGWFGEGYRQKRRQGFEKRTFSRGICWVKIIHNPLLWVLSDALATERPQKFLRKLGKINSCRKTNSWEQNRTASNQAFFGGIWRFHSYIPLN